MEIIEKKLEELKPYENNPRKNDEAVDYVANSIKEFGFKVPIVIDKNNVIVTGHTRYKASQKLGLKTVPCIIADDLTDEQIKAFRLADNKVSDFSLWDNKKLLQELDEINSDIFTGFTESELFEDIKLTDVFDEVDERDNQVLENNKNGVMYSINFKTQDEELINKIKEIVEENTGETF